MIHIQSKQCDGFAQGIVGRQPSGRVPAHAHSNSTVEVDPSCLRMEGCYTKHAWLRNTMVVIK
jgi:hypothetical protein